MAPAQASASSSVSFILGLPIFATAHAVCGCIVGGAPGVLYAPKNIFGRRNGRAGKATKLADMTTHFDAIVVGTGQAGPALAARLSGAGMKVAVIERDKFG